MPSRPIFSDTDIDPSAYAAREPNTKVEDPFTKKKVRRRTSRVRLKTSQWVEHFVRIKDGDRGVVKPIEFSERQYLRRVYDTQARKILFMTSRQTEKSTTLGNRLLSLVGMNPMYTALFVTPSAMQTKVFSTARIDDIIDLSPLVKALTHKSLTYNLLEKHFLNKSVIYLRYAFLSADRIRGLSNNAVFADEVQDLLQDVMPVIAETASHFKNSLYVYSGTPKTFDNTIEGVWSKQSTQSEWCIPCEKHGTPNQPGTWHWNVLGPKNIGKKGPICDRCGSPINPEHPLARWVEMNPGAEFEGYRICRLMVPWFWKPDMDSPDPYAKWRSIIYAMENYPTAQFMNEVMALSFDAGTKPITRAELSMACDETRTYLMDEEEVAKLAQSHELFGGIDWGTGEHAYTVMTVGGYVRGDSSFQILYSKRFDGQLIDPDPQMEEIVRLINKFRLKFVGVDYGMGFHPNKKLTSIYGPKRIHQFQYASRAPKKVVYKGALNRYIVFRTPIMADIFMALKTKKIRLPDWDVYRTPFADDILSIHSEYSDAMKMIKYDKPRSIPDDTFHSIIYCLLASFLQYRRPDIIAPIQEYNSSEAAWRRSEDMAMEEIEAKVGMDYAL